MHTKNQVTFRHFQFCLHYFFYLTKLTGSVCYNECYRNVNICCVVLLFFFLYASYISFKISNINLEFLFLKLIFITKNNAVNMKIKQQSSVLYLPLSFKQEISNRFFTILYHCKLWVIKKIKR